MSIIAKYKFDSSIYADLIPEFNAEFTSDLYTITDEVDSENSNHIIRTIESDSLPTLMRFGRVYVEGETVTDNRTDSLLEILDMNTTGLTDCNYMFRYNTNLTSISCEWDTSNVTTMYTMFHNCSNLNSLDVSNWDTSNVTSMTNTFNGCSSLTLLDINNWDTSNVTNMQNMFRYCTLTSLDVSNWNTSNVTNMSGMFYNCINLTSLDVSNWNTSRVTDMHGMFQYCSSLTSLDISNWDTSNTETIHALLYNTALYTINISNLDLNHLATRPDYTSNGQSIFGADTGYANKGNLSTVHFTEIDLPTTVDFSNMFLNRTGLKYIQCNNINNIPILIEQLPARTADDPGFFVTNATYTDEMNTALVAKYWNFINLNEIDNVIVQYKYDMNICRDMLPVFNADFTGYFWSDVIEDEENSNIVTRTIKYIDDSLPTLIRFGRPQVDDESDINNRTDSLLEVLNMDTSELTSCNSMFRYCKNLISITCNWSTSKVTDMRSMFAHCNNLTLLDVSNFDTNKVTTMRSMFYNCQVLTSLDVSNWNTINANNIQSMFYNCYKLTSLDVSNFDTSKVTDTHSMFYYCYNLTSLDLSNFDTSKINNMKDMFAYCNKLTSLDLSNFDTNKVTTISGMFTNTLLLTDIGMLYCDQSTINKIASLLPTDTTQTIWVEDVDVKDLTPVEGVEFKQYTKNTEIMLTSPLLEGDKLIVKDGKLYHYHKRGRLVLNGSEYWSVNTSDSNIVSKFYGGYGDMKIIDDALKNSTVICDKFNSVQSWNCEYPTVYISSSRQIVIFMNKSEVLDVDGFKQWLSENPTTVVYKLASPYYELISEDPLTISLIAESSDITNSSNIPLNMTINNKGLSTVAMSPSTTYTVAFDKDIDSEVVVNLCGNEVTTTDNIVEITTPSEIDDELIFYGNGVEVSNVRLLEGSVSEDSVPRETFEGLKNSFEDGYIPENELVDFPTDIYLNGSSYQEGNGDGCTVYYHTVSLKTNIVYTVFCNINEETTCTDGLGLRFVAEKQHDIITGDLTTMKGIFCNTFTLTNTLRETKNLEIWNRDNGIVSISNMTILEGDWTHLTHLTEEDFSHAGKYKVEYKVTGKNKFDIGSSLGSYLIDSDTGSLKENVNWKAYDYTKVNPNTTYTLSEDNTIYMQYTIGLYDYQYNFVGCEVIEKGGIYSYSFRTPDNVYYCRVYHSIKVHDASVVRNNIQLEEGSTVTEYEPYKEYTKTFYLNSPLLEGDTIEDVNGVATHVKRYEKIVLDGSEDEGWTGTYLENSAGAKFFQSSTIFPTGVVSSLPYCDKLQTLQGNQHSLTTSGQLVINQNKEYSNNCYVSTNLTTYADFSNWLQVNPTTVVYQLASPIYETISTESILCDSYAKGHLDFDTNIPIEKVEFQATSLSLKYLSPNKNYKVQLDSDNEGILAWGIGGHSNGINENIVKGKNVLNVITGDKLNNDRLYMTGIGFNASNIQVVATDRDVDFGYFKGLQSSFENNMENLWDGTLIEGVHITSNFTYSEMASETRSACIKCKPNTTYIITATNNNRLRIGHVSELVEAIPCITYDIDDTNIEYKEFTTANKEGYLVVYVANESNTNENITVDIREKANRVECKVVGKNKWDGNWIDGYIEGDTLVYKTGQNTKCAIIKVQKNTTYTVTRQNGNRFAIGLIEKYPEWKDEVNVLEYNSAKYSLTFTTSNTDEYVIIYIANNEDTTVPLIQLEEGTQATSYEPYQEYTKTIHLNSPLLKGDTIEVHNGKLCHYHKMGKVMLDGSEDWKINTYWVSSSYRRFHLIFNTNGNWFSLKSDKLKTIVFDGDMDNQFTECISCYDTGTEIVIQKNNILTLDEFKQWLQANPTTVVYELAEPYYEEITPSQEDLIITSVKEGDLHIDTIVPISSKVTYNVNVQLLTDFEQSIVEQVQATQTTDLQSILDEEIDN